MTTLVIQTGTDTYLKSNATTSNFATDTLLRVGELAGVADENYRTLIKFDLATLPDDAVISSVVLSLYAFSDWSTVNRTFRVFRQKRAWVVNQATWNIYSTGNNWQAAGGFGADDCEQIEIGSRNFINNEAVSEFKDFTLTAVSKAALDLGNGWLIKADTELNDSFFFASFNNATEANRPKLTIEYTLPPSSAGGGYRGQWTHLCPFGY